MEPVLPVPEVELVLSVAEVEQVLGVVLEEAADTVFQGMGRLR